MSARAQIGVTGLAVMGRNLARNFARRLHGRGAQPLVRQDRVPDRRGGHRGRLRPSESMADFVASLERPRKVVIMVKAGAATDAVIDELVPLLEEGDIVVDAGNAHFPDTIRREKALAALGLHFVGTGVSGGEEGRALNGPSIMPGGTRESYQSLGPILEDISAKVDGVPCCTYVGPDGAGHFVKMVHNGIEYADMQLIAEAYDLLKQGLGASAQEIGEIFAQWNTGDLESFLIEITADVLQHVDAETGKAFVDVVLDQAEQKGTGRWTVQNGLDLGVPITGIAEATFARALSGSVRSARRVALRCPPTPRRGTCRTATRSSRTCVSRSTRRRSSPTRRASTRSRPRRPSTAGTSTAARWPASGAAAASSGRASSTASPRRTSATRSSAAPRRRVLHGRGRQRPRGVASRRGPGRPERRADARVLVVARLLRRRAGRAPARRAHPGAARLLRRAHLPPRRQAGRVPHRVVGRPDHPTPDVPPDVPTAVVVLRRGGRRRASRSARPCESADVAG